VKGGHETGGLKTLAIVLIVIGVLALAYGGFTYTRETHHATMGSMDLPFSERQTVNFPLWTGVGAVAVGGVLLLTPMLRGRRE